MAKKLKEGKEPRPPTAGRPSSLLDTRVIYCGDNLELLAKPALSLSNGLPDRCGNLNYIDPAPVNSNADCDICFAENSARRSSSRMRPFSPLTRQGNG